MVVFSPYPTHSCCSKLIHTVRVPGLSTKLQHRAPHYDFSKWMVCWSYHPNSTQLNTKLWSRRMFTGLRSATARSYWMGSDYSPTAMLTPSHVVHQIGESGTREWA